VFDTPRPAGTPHRWTICAVSSARVIRDGKWVARYPDWLEHADLVLLAAKPLARFTREVKTEKFELEPSAPIKTKPDKSF
jgi:hypothetical protein